MTLLAILGSVLSMTAIVAARYFASSGLFAWISARRVPGIHDKLGPQMQREIRWSLVSAAIFGIPAGVVAWGW
ncbi:MAG: fatty acid hydroxylase family protein, partial [Pseudomonadota bacterium]|nr:fatty acid hydroxylase family protein [Pseudomonadota bacterium]